MKFKKGDRVRLTPAAIRLVKSTRPRRGLPRLGDSKVGRDYGKVGEVTEVRPYWSHPTVVVRFAKGGLLVVRMDDLEHVQ